MHQIALVEFFGPALNRRGNLWGFITLFDDTSTKLYVEEPWFGSRPIEKHTVVVVETGHDERPHLVEVWHSNDLGINALRELMSSTSSRHETLPVQLQALVSRLPTDDRLNDLLVLRTDRQIADSILGRRSTYADEIRRSIALDRTPSWIPLIEVDVPLPEQALMRLAELLGPPHMTAAIARHLLSKHQTLDAMVARSLISSSTEWIPAVAPLLDSTGLDALLRVLPHDAWAQLARAADPGSAVLVDQLFGFMDADARVKGLLGAVGRGKWCKVVERRGLDTLRSWVADAPDVICSWEIGKLDPEFVLNVPDCLKASPDKAFLYCAVALRDSTKADPRTAPFLTYLRERFSEWRQADGDVSLVEGAAIQAQLLLRFHTSIARRLNDQQVLFPEVAHIIGCGDEVACMASGTLRDRLGHALGATARSRRDVALEAEVQARRIAEALLSGWGEQPSVTRSLDRLVEAVTLAFAARLAPLLSERSVLSRGGELSKALPRCRVGIVPFCEAKLPTDGFRTPYCPRLKTGCKEAVVEFAPGRSAPSWSLIDVFRTAGRFSGDGGSKKTMVNAVAGWVNRLLELEQRMECRDCGAPLMLNPRYSIKYTARYAATVMLCSKRCGSASVYLSHCFHCQGVIDSRESRLRFDSASGRLLGEELPDRVSGTAIKYLCIRCANDLAPWCPRCGASAESTAPRPRQRACGACGHMVEAGSQVVLPHQPLRLRKGPWASIGTHGTEHRSWATDPRRDALSTLASSKLGCDF